ncbi:MAG: DUF6056 family protein [Verrucomicrobiota bacterium]
MTKSLNLGTRWQAWLLLLLAAFVVTPFVALCFYAHPSADDWYMAATGREKGLIGVSVFWYQNMSGRLVQQGIASLHPVRLGITAYQVWCLAWIVGLGLGFHAAVKSWFSDLGKGPRLVITVSALMLALWSMRSPAQGLYWVNGGDTYLLPAILQLSILSLLGRSDSPKVFTHALAAFLALAASLCSELAMALQMLCFILYAGYSWFTTRRVPRLVFTLMAGTLVAALIIFLSPGVPLRMASYANDVRGHPVPALIQAAKLAVVNFGAWVTFTPFFLVSLLLLTWWPVREMTARNAFALIVFAILMIIGTTWGGLFIGSWATGQRLPPRAVNLLGLFFVVEWAVLLSGVAAWIRAVGWSKPSLTPAAFLIVFLGVAATLRAPGNVKSAWRDLLKGDAKKFHLECEARYALITESKADEVTVPPLRVKPATLFFNDLKPDATDWRNAGMAEFYQKKAIHLSE